eukprot:TRINITY_DN19104_c0_g1_i1.p1 TRINITY_DN19104_c0_g1~~TRINITY_DN19104_c0_g1_i1.p1  ORF type:complete len:123 (+),score=7.38 TRINITY_DN19104_c0_g1_i1:3-371(+)
MIQPVRFVYQQPLLIVGEEHRSTHGMAQMPQNFQRPPWQSYGQSHRDMHYRDESVLQSFGNHGIANTPPERPQGNRTTRGDNLRAGSEELCMTSAWSDNHTSLRADRNRNSLSRYHPYGPDR